MAAVVIDIGSGQVKAGLASEAEPTTCFPTLVGRNRGRSLCVPDGDPAPERVLRRRASSICSSPLERGVVHRWPHIKLILKEVYNSLDIDASEQAALVSGLLPMDDHDSEMLGQLVFEEFQVPALRVEERSSFLTLLGAGWTDGVVVDMGYGLCRVAAFQAGAPVGDEAAVPLAGQDVDAELGRLLTATRAGAGASFPSHLTPEIRERVAVVGAAPGECAQGTSYRLPDDSLLSVKDERYACMEVLFRPPAAGGEALIPAVAAALRSLPASDVLLSGGLASTPGLAQRLEAGLEGAHVTVSPHPVSDAWRGGARLAQSTEGEQWISLEHYQEQGPEVMYRHDRS